MTDPTPPLAPRRPHRHVAHGHERTDDWFWLHDAEDPEVVAYLEAENRYAEQVLAPLSALRDELFDEIRTRVQETDAGPPTRSGGWWYYARTFEGLQYAVQCRLADPDGVLSAAEVAGATRSGRPEREEVVLDENELAGGSDFLAVGVYDISPDHSLLAYGIDLDGSEKYSLRFRDLSTGRDRPEVIDGVYYGSAWSADGSIFFYTRPDEAMRPWQVWAHRLGDPPGDDRLVFQEDDARFFVDVELSRTRARIVIHSASKTSSEVRWLDASAPAGEPVVLLPRRPGVEYDAEHDGDGWLIRTNAAEPGGGPRTNFALLRLTGGDGAGPTVAEIIGHRAEVKLESVDAFAGFTAVVERSAEDGLERIRILDRSGGDHVIDQPEAAYTLTGGHNPEWDQDAYRFGYTSMVTPRTSIDYRVPSRAREVVWAQIVHGYDPSQFRTERLWADAGDGARVPITLVCRRDQEPDGSAAGLLYGYGAYEISVDPTFSPNNMNLVRRGVVMAIAHVRGGGELGRRWYEQGRMENKANTFTDFIAAAEALVAAGWVGAGRLAARGGSAGGLLMGAVLNMRPDLWRVMVAEVPFVDVVTTMSDTSLPLTVTEWEEWGDPLNDPAAYQRMVGYSPYDNVAAGRPYPALYVTAGLNDPNVGFWEPAKWVTRLRWAGAGTAGRPLVLRTEMGAGHQGPSGRYDAWRDEARIQAFVLDQLTPAGGG
ncbi:MAG TPA: S9 family peptidase [Acidimicrobiales bacterium]|nr:S9 family peptidase [Acidimicrobiales bacterium]